MSELDRNQIEERIARLADAQMSAQRVTQLLGAEGNQDTILTYLTDITEDYRRAYEKMHGEGAIPKDKPVDDAGAQLLKLPDPKELIEIGLRIEEMQRAIIQKLHISTEDIREMQAQETAGSVIGHENMQVADDIHTPPDDFVWPEGDGEVQRFQTEFSERLTALRYLLYSLDIDPDDKKQVIIEVRRIQRGMMRQVSYVSVFIKPLGRLVELCNQVGNRSFIWRSRRKTDIAKYADMGKEEKKQLIDEDPEKGWHLVMSADWMAQMQPMLEGEAEPQAPRVLREMRDKEEAANAIRQILEDEGILRVEEREPEDESEEKERVLVWMGTINPNKKYGGYNKTLRAIFLIAVGIKGVNELGSFAGIVPHIRTLYAGRFEREEFGNLDIEFEFADQERQREMLRALLEAEDVLRIEEREIEGTDGEKERVLVWVGTITPNQKCGEYKKKLKTLFGNALDIEHASEKLQSFEVIVPHIRTLYAGRFEREEFGNLDIEFEFADQERQREMLRTLLEDEKVLRIEEREIEGTDGEKERVLVWLGCISPAKKYGKYKKKLKTLFGNALDIKDVNKLGSFEAIVPHIRTLYVGRFKREEFGNLDIEFEFADQERQREMLRALLEAEDVLRIEEREREDGSGKTENVLVWVGTISPRNKYGGYEKMLSTLFGNALGIKDTQNLLSFAATVPHIRTLYAGRFEREEFGNLDIEFEFADQERQRGMLRALLEAEDVLRIEEREIEGTDGEKERVLVWVETIRPDKKCNGYSKMLKTLFGNALGIKDANKLESFEATVPHIRTLYAGRFEREEFGNLDIEFEFADQERQRGMLRALLEAEDVLRIEEREREDGSGKTENVLVWMGTINLTKKYDEYEKQVRTLFGNALSIENADNLGSFAAIVPHIRTLYKGMYDREDTTNLNT